MKVVLSREQMRAFDAHAITRCKVPGLILMENAGRGATEVIARVATRARAITVVCGTGNNGGDGFVIARHLRARGADVRCLLAGARDKVRGDALVNLEAVEGIGVAIEPAGPIQGEVIVDALFGTGLDRPIEGELAELVRAINAARALKIAVDLPSGLDANTGRELGVAARADHTVTFAHPKLGLLTPSGAELSGTLHVVDLGVPSSLASHVGHEAELIEERDVAEMFAPRAKDAHKYRAGHVGVIAGSPGKIGAALLVARGALRAGAGATTLGTFAGAYEALASRVLEIMTAELSDAASIDAFAASKRALVVGPGLGGGARAVVERLIASFRGPLVLDADALTCFAARELRGASLILTPHAGEAAHLLGTTAAEIERDRFGAARALARESGAVVLLKGLFTLVAHPDGLWVNPTGAPALATAGSGDVLAGVIGALACAMPAARAAIAGAFVHGLAGEGWPSDRGMLAHEIADRVPAVLGALTTAHAPRATGHADG